MEIHSMQESGGIAQELTNRPLRHAAQQFEALLLQSLLRTSKTGASSFPGESCLGSDSYSDFAAEALASGLAAAGGVGLSNLLFRALNHTKGADSSLDEVPRSAQSSQLIDSKLHIQVAISLENLRSGIKDF